MIHFLDERTDLLTGYLDGGEDKNFTMDEIEEGTDGTRILNFVMPAKIFEAIGVEDGKRILVPGDKMGWSEFVCYQATQTRTGKKVTAVGSEVELDKLKYVEPAVHEAMGLREYMQLGVDGLEWEVGNVVGTGLQALSFDTYLGGHEYMQRLANAFEVEMVYRVEVKGQHVIGRYVDAYFGQGESTGKEFINAKDIVSIEKTVHTDRIVTALLVIGPDDADGNPRQPVLVTNKEAFQRWNRNGQHRIGIHNIDSSDEDMTQEKMIQYGTTELNKRIASVVDYTMEAVDLAPYFPHEAAYLGDRVTIKDEEFNPPLIAQARIINMKRRIKREGEERPSVKTLTVGEVVTYSQEDLNKRLVDMRKRFEMLIKEAERKALEAQALAEGFTDTEAFIQAMAEKANASDLGEYATKEELALQDQEAAARVLEAMQNLDLSDYITKAEADAKDETIIEKIAESNAPNILKNSLGFAGLDFWHQLSIPPVLTVQNESLRRLNFGAGFFFPAAAAGTRTIEQIVQVVQGRPLTFSWFAEKTVAGIFRIEILEEETVRLTVPDFSDPTYEFRSSWIPYTPETGQIAIRITAAASAEVTVTGMMLSYGTTPNQWQTAPGELYNAYVRNDETGIKVIRIDSNGMEEGFTHITPEEFAIYYDENKTGNPIRMFWFDRDETVTKKLRATDEITMGTLKLIRVDSPTNRGWALVKNTEDSLL